VTIGRVVSPSRWERTLRRALAGEEGWVVQELISAVRVATPVITGKRVRLETLFANFGVIPLPAGTGILGRASAAPVVNVAQGGGIVAILKGEPQGAGRRRRVKN